jgi:hypothetical protein
MRIAVADTTILSVNHQLAALITRDFTACGNGFFLRSVNRRCTLAAGATDSPATIVWDYMLIPL